MKLGNTRGSKIGSNFEEIRLCSRKIEGQREAQFGEPHVVQGGWKTVCDRKSRALLKIPFKSVTPWGPFSWGTVNDLEKTFHRVFMKLI